MEKKSKCIFCSDTRATGLLVKVHHFGARQFSCPSCGTFAMCRGSALIPDGLQNQTPAMLTAYKHALEEAQSKIKDRDTEMVHICIQTVEPNSEPEIRRFAEKHNVFPEEVRKYFKVETIRTEVWQRS